MKELDVRYEMKESGVQYLARGMSYRRGLCYLSHGTEWALTQQLDASAYCSLPDGAKYRDAAIILRGGE